MIFIIFVNALYTLGIWPNIDSTPVAIGISNVFVTWALFRNKLFDLVPVARGRVMESMSDGIVVMDAGLRIVDLNPSAQSIFQCAAYESIGLGADDFFSKWRDLRALVIKDQGYTEFEYASGKDCSYYEALCRPIINDRETILGKLLIIRDITEKKMTEINLLKKQHELAVKEERERMARDLHDNIGQILGFVNVQTQAIMEYLRHDQLQTALGCLERLTEVAQEAHNTVRETIIAMRGEKISGERKLSDYFIELERQLHVLKHTYGIDTEIDIRRLYNVDDYDSKVLEHMENMIKEALNNIIKHANASAVKILLEESAKGISLTIIDDGCGFRTDRPASGNNNKYGLLFMKERAEEIGGCLDIESEIGKGTTIRIQIPSRQIVNLV